VLSNEDSYNRVWSETSGGYVYSGYAQPVRWQLQARLSPMPGEGFLGEVTVPPTLSRTFPHLYALIRLTDVAYNRFR
jgi:hypothetical protein